MSLLSDALTKHLLYEEETSNPEIVGIFAGGFKPPTKGHLKVVEEALVKYPEMDKLIILVGSGVRDSISQKESLAIWGIYKNYLPNKVEILPSPQGKPPIGAIYSYAKNHLDKKIYWILGAREGDEGDVKDILQRTKSLSSGKYSNLETKQITTGGDAVSGTKARNALLSRNKEEFLTYFPNIPEVDEIWDMLVAINESSLESNFISQDDVDFVDNMADDKLAPVDIDLTGTHFFSRLNDPRNTPNISVDELESFFDKLSDEKETFIDFIKKYKDIVVKDSETNINIPFMKMANKAIAKTVMRKKNFQTSNKVISLQEGRYDQEILMQSRYIINLFKATLGEELEETTDGNMDGIEYELQIDLIPDGIETLGPLPYIINGGADEYSISIQINYNPSSFPASFNNLVAEIKDTLRHELEHLGQYYFGKEVEPDGTNPDDLPSFEYFTLDYEVPAFVQGLYKTAKTKKITLTQAIDEFLSEREVELTDEESAKVKQIWINWAKENLPSAQFEGNINEDISNDVLDSFDIQDTLVKDVWVDNKLKPEIREKLLKIAQDFYDSLELPEDTILRDVKLTGSLANFNWSKFSDVDLHLVLDFSEIADNEEFARDYFMAKKNLWNNAHDVDIFGYPVEVYVEDKDEPHTASGLYSILNDEWITIPQQQKIVIDKDDISSKAEGYISIIPQLEKMFEEGKYENLIDKIDKIKERIRDMRSSGLERGGLYSVENLAFKVLRRSNYVEKLNDFKIKSYDALMSLNELLNENASYSKDIDFKKKILDLTKHMLDKGMNIKPLPKVKFVNGDSENARDFLGKTAYYDPNTSTITLYTEGRHPKDIVRSFSHEMIHHIQNLEDRLGDISTSNTMEDDHIDKLEQEANLKGTMTFRNWTDSIGREEVTNLNEIGEGTSEPFKYQKSRNSVRSGFKYLIDSYVTKDGETVDSNIELQGVVFNEELYYHKKDFLDAAKMEEEDTLEGIEISFYNVKADNSTTNMFSAVNDRVFMFRLMATIKQILLKEIPNHKVDVLVYSPTKESDEQNTEQTGRHRLYTAFIKKVFPNARMHVDGQDNLVYFFLNESLNEAIVGNKIECDNCDWSWNIVDGGGDLFICHKCGHNNKPISENKNKDLFGLNSHIHKLFEDLEEPIINKEMTTKEFIDTVNDEFDVETLELMQSLIDKRLTLLNTMTDIATKKQIKGFKRYN